jgi:hypothetical protein
MTSTDIYIPKYMVGTPVYQVKEDNKVHTGYIKAYTVEEVVDENSQGTLISYYTVAFQGYATENVDPASFEKKYYLSKEKCAKDYIKKEYPYLFNDANIQ